MGKRPFGAMASNDAEPQPEAHLVDLAPRHISIEADERPEGKPWLWVGSAFLLTLCVLPVVALLLAAFPVRPLSKLRDPMVLSALRLSVTTSLTSTLLCVAMGLPVAYLLARHRFAGKVVLDTVLALPMALPPVVAGVALLLAFGRAGIVGKHLDALGVRIPFTAAAVVMAQTFMAAPFFVRSARAGFEAVPLRLEHAAMTLGAGRWRVFWTVCVPLASPALLAGVVLAWARALGEFGATMMFAGNLPGVTQTLPLAVMSAMETNLDTAVSISVLSLLLAFGALVGTRLLVTQWR